MSNGSDIKPTDLRGILKYVPRFQGQTFVIALDGIIVASYAEHDHIRRPFDVQQVAGLFVLVALHRLARLQVRQLGQARTLEHAADRGLRDAHAARDARLQHAALAQLDDEQRLARLDAPGRTKRARGGIGQASVVTVRGRIVGFVRFRSSGRDREAANGQALSGRSHDYKRNGHLGTLRHLAAVWFKFTP